MVTVEADVVRVESRLVAGGIGCPVCGEGVLVGWGYARVRRIDGLGGSIRPRRGTVTLFENCCGVVGFGAVVVDQLWVVGISGVPRGG